MKGVEMDNILKTSKLNSVTTIWRRSLLCIALLFVCCPSTTHEELTARSRRFPLSPQATGNREKMSATLEHGISASGSFRQTAAMTNGNVTLESVNERLVRLDENVATLIQSVLTVQRTVFNLEQLQELLVLLLEDILKQTGSVDKIPRTDTTKPTTLGGENSGGTSFSTDSDDKDSADVTSAERDDGVVDDKVAANPDHSNGVVTDSGRQNEQAIRNSLPLGPFGIRNEQFGMSALSQSSNGFPARQSTDPIPTAANEDSAGGSSEGDGSNSNEDYSGGFMRVMQRSTQPGNTPGPNSRRPQWSEPIMAHGTSDIHSRLFDVVHRITSHLGQSAGRTSPRLLGLTQGHSAPHQKQTESIFDHPPLYEPLEIVPAQDTTFMNEKNAIPRMFPMKVKLLPESVISHGGPLTGPEHYSSLYLEHPEDYQGAELTGERSTGIISNLVQLNSNPVTGHDPHVNTTTGVDSVGQINVGISVTDIRRRREAPNNFSLDSRIDAVVGNQEVFISPHSDGSQRNNDSFIAERRTSARNMTSSRSSNSFNMNEHNTEFQHSVSKDNSMNLNYSHKLLKNKEVKQSATGGPEYDDLIARLLTDLSTQLHTMHTESDASYDDAFSRATSELDKLIWVSTDSVSNSPGTFDMTNTSVVDEKTEDTDDVTRMKASGEQVLQSYPVDIKYLNRVFSGKFEHRNENESLTRKKANTLTYTRKDNNISNEYAMPKSENNMYREMFISDLARMRNLNRQEVATKANITAQGDLNNVTTTTHNQWDWLYQLIGSAEVQTADVTSLIDTLNELSRNQSFLEELTDINNKGRSILGRSAYTDEVENKISPDTDSDVVNNVTSIDNDNINDDYKLTSALDNSSSSEEDDEEVDDETTKLRKTSIVANDAFKVSEKDGSARNVNHKDYVNFNQDSNVSGDEEKVSKSNERKESDDKSDDIDSADVDENIQNIPNTRHVQGILKTDSVLGTLSKTKAQLSSLSTRQTESIHPDDKLNNIRKTVIYSKPTTAENKQHETNAAIKTQIQHKQIENSISRQKRQAGFKQNKSSHSNVHSRHFPNQHKTPPQAQKSSGSTGVITSHNDLNKTLDESTRNADVNLQNASQTLSNADVHKHNIPQQVDLKSTGNSSQTQHDRSANHPDIYHTDSQGYDQSSHNLLSFDSQINGHSQTFNNPDYESFGGTSSPEDMETPSAEEHSALDLEEVLTSLFLTYWQRFYHLYTRASPLTTTTPADLEIEEEVTEMTLTTAVSPVLTSVTADNNNTHLTSTASVAAGLDKAVANTTSTDTVGG